MKNVSALIVAAGTGSRMKSKIPKQFLKLDNHTILFHSIRKFLSVPDIAEIIVIGPPDYLNSPEMAASIPTSQIPIKIVPGGRKRQESVTNGLNAIRPDTDIVLIHDGARPLVATELIQQSIDCCRNNDGAVLACPSINSLKEVKDKLIIQTIDRTTVWQAQTPQTFRRKIIQQAYQHAIHNRLTATDDAGLVEAIGGQVIIIESPPRNLKITSPDDLQIARTLFEKDPT